MHRLTSNEHLPLFPSISPNPGFYDLPAKSKYLAVPDSLIDLTGIEELAGISKRTTNRICKADTGMAPLQRLREPRMTHARGVAAV